MSEQVAVGTLGTILKDVIAMPEMRYRLDLIHSQESPVQFAFGVTPPPSPRGPSAPAIAQYGPTDGTKGINEDAVPQPPPPTLPEIKRSDMQQERFEEFQAEIERASAKVEEARRLTRGASVYAPNQSKDG